MNKIQFAITYGAASLSTAGDTAEVGVEEALDLIRDIAFGITKLEGNITGYYNVCELIFRMIWTVQDCPKAQQVAYAFQQLKSGNSELLDRLYEKNQDTFLVS